MRKYTLCMRERYNKEVMIWLDQKKIYEEKQQLLQISRKWAKLTDLVENRDHDLSETS